MSLQVVVCAVTRSVFAKSLPTVTCTEELVHKTFVSVSRWKKSVYTWVKKTLQYTYMYHFRWLSLLMPRWTCNIAFSFHGAIKMLAYGLVHKWNTIYNLHRGIKNYVIINLLWCFCWCSCDHVVFSSLQRGSVCNDRGTCLCDRCDCLPEWEGNMCQIPVS